MSRKHHSEPTDHPTHPTGGPGGVSQRQVEKANAAETSDTSRKERMVDIGRAENTAARQKEGRGR